MLFSPSFRRPLLLLILVCWSVGLQAEAITRESSKQAVVKIFTSAIAADYYEPWRMLSPQSATGSGAVINGNRILTNAHVVANARYIQVQKYGQAQKTPARVLFVSHEADLALITVDDTDFFEGIKPLALGKLPEAQEQVTVVGYPFGGNSLSITQGVLSRLEHRRYAHSGRQLFAGQIDAAINPGNSGGPVLVNNKIVGIVMQGIQSVNSENLGYMIPLSVIEHFLEDIKDDAYGGIPALPLVVQALENPGMREKFNFPDQRTGILVSKVLHFNGQTTPLQPGDIVTAIDGQDVANDLTVEFRPNERTNWEYLVDQKQVGESVKLGLFRNGNDIEVEFTLNGRTNDYLVVDLQEYGKRPRYYVYGGVVFTPMSTNLVQRWGKDWFRNAPNTLTRHIGKLATAEQREIVVALRVLPSAINRGYHEYANGILASVNGQEFKNFAEFVNLLQNNDRKFLTFEDENSIQLVIHAEAEPEANAEIMQAYGVGSALNLSP